MIVVITISASSPTCSAPRTFWTISGGLFCVLARVHAVEDHDELVAGIACDALARTDGNAQALCELGQQRTADGVPVRVIDTFEAIDDQKRQRESARQATRVRKRLRQLLVEKARLSSLVSASFSACSVTFIPEARTVVMSVIKF